jgi:hypothetical protein
VHLGRQQRHRLRHRHCRPRFLWNRRLTRPGPVLHRRMLLRGDCGRVVLHTPPQVPAYMRHEVRHPHRLQCR